MPYIPTGNPPGRPRAMVLEEDLPRMSNVIPGRTIVIPRGRLVTLSASGISVASLARVYGVPDSTMRTFLRVHGCVGLFPPTTGD